MQPARSSLLATVLAISAGGAAHAQILDPIVHEATIEAPIAVVWEAWTTSEGLRSWMAPHAEIDARIGGIMRSNYNAAEGLDGPNAIENVVLSLEPYRMLSFRVSKAPDDFPFPNAVKHMWSVLYLDELGPDETHIRIVSAGFGSDEESQNMRAFFVRGNAFTLEQLERRFAAPTPSW